MGCLDAALAGFSGFQLADRACASVRRSVASCRPTMACTIWARVEREHLRDEQVHDVGLDAGAVLQRSGHLEGEACARLGVAARAVLDLCVGVTHDLLEHDVDEGALARGRGGVDQVLRQRLYSSSMLSALVAGATVSAQATSAGSSSRGALGAGTRSRRSRTFTESAAGVLPLALSCGPPRC